MNMLEKLLACGLALTVGFGVVGCDEEEAECNEAGVCTDGGAGGAGGEGGFGGEGGAGGGGETSAYTDVIITDTSADLNMAGAPGVDICSVQSSDCGMPTGAMLDPGDGDPCIEGEEGPDGEICSGTRNIADAALSFEMECMATGNRNDYVSLGQGGTLTVMFENDLAGCQLEILELEGGDDESFDLEVCANGDTSDCLLNADNTTILLEGGVGSASVTLPAAPVADDGEGGEGGE